MSRRAFSHFGDNGGVSILLTVVSLAVTAPFATAAQGFDHTHSAWERVLKSHVKTQGPKSSVDYAGLKADPQALNAYLTSLSKVTEADFERFERAQKLSFLINAYNAFTLSFVTTHYPVKTMKSIGGLFSNPWKKKFFLLFGAERSLDDVEHEMIRKRFKEPRIHFALVCAAVSCPPLRGEAYVAPKLDAQLSDQARLFLNDTDKNRVEPLQMKLSLSSIFKWYREDFEAHSGTLQAYVAPYLDGLRGKDAQVSFLEYDWSLNEYKAEHSRN